MSPFSYFRPDSIEAALAQHDGVLARYLAGGTNLIDLMKIDVEKPNAVIDVNRLALTAIESGNGALRIGALARMSDVAAHAAVVADYPVIAQALVASASPQLRNMASIGGNLLQRTRCSYFRDIAFAACNKRNPGSGCAALAGENRRHAVLGVSPSCIAVHPSDLAVALVALDATVHLRSTRGERALALDDFYVLPGNTPDKETRLQPGEMVVAVEVPASTVARHSTYLKIRDRAAFEFALVSAAVGVALAADGRIADARVALGGVGSKPWRARRAEALLVGEPPQPALFATAAAVALEGAQTQQQNAFKVELARRTLTRALRRAASTEEISWTAG